MDVFQVPLCSGVLLSLVAAIEVLVSAIDASDFSVQGQGGPFPVESPLPSDRIPTSHLKSPLEAALAFAA